MFVWFGAKLDRRYVSCRVVGGNVCVCVCVCVCVGPCDVGLNAGPHTAHRSIAHANHPILRFKMVTSFADSVWDGKPSFELQYHGQVRAREIRCCCCCCWWWWWWWCWDRAWLLTWPGK
jgi:hypothetical protein